MALLRAFLLALFSHFVTKMLADFHLDLYGPESLIDLFEHKDEKMEEEIKNGQSEEDKIEVKDKKKRSRMNRLRRRRRGSSSEEEGSDFETEEEEESDGEEEDSEEESESSEEDHILDYDSDEEEEDEDEDVVVEGSEVILSTRHVVKLVGEHHLGKAVRICGLW